MVVSRSYGWASVEFSVPTRKDTVYQLASATNLFTGMAIMMLVEEGKLSLDDRIVKLLPELPLGWANVIVERLLTHTSGLPDWFGVTPNPRSAGDARRNHQEGFTITRRIPAGEKWSYN